jgi:hypothetical protein
MRNSDIYGLHERKFLNEKKRVLPMTWKLCGHSTRFGTLEFILTEKKSDKICEYDKILRNYMYSSTLKVTIIQTRRITNALVNF